MADTNNSVAPGGTIPTGGNAGTIKVRQIGSPIRRPKTQRQILTGLGLGKMHRVVELKDTAEVRGMIAKLPHMVEIVRD